MRKLYIVPTPIGNLDDMTFRAIKVLQSADFVLSEDTRTTGKLLKHFAINQKQRPYHKFNEHKVSDAIVEELRAGQTAALVTDAGTPGISDPGYLITKKCIENNIAIETLPGATSFVPALVNSGLPCDRFVFEGFLPQKKGRQTRLKMLAEEERTLVLFESPYRVVKTLKDFAAHAGRERQVSLSREISKMYEETLRGTLIELIEKLDGQKLKGEFVLIVQGKN